MDSTHGMDSPSNTREEEQMFEFLEKYTIKRLRKEIRTKEQAALRVQRDGYLRTYAKLMLEIDRLNQRLGQLTLQ